MPSINTRVPPARRSTVLLVYLKSLPLNSRIWRLWTSSSAAYVYFLLVVQCGDSHVLFDQVTFGLTPNGQIWPRALNADIGGVAGSIYLIVNDIGTNSGSGLDFINGQTFLERFYSVFDTGNKQVGLATTPFTGATTNWEIQYNDNGSIDEIFFSNMDIVKNFFGINMNFLASTFNLNSCVYL